MVKKIFVPVLIALLLIGGLTFLFLNRTSELSPDEAGERVINFINETFLQGVASAELIEISTESGLYKMKILIDGNEFETYSTKDGKLFFPEVFNMSNNLPTEDPIGEPEIEELPENIEGLISCLDGEGVKIYGAEWCPYCQQLISSFGGREIVAPLYVECTEEEELCQEKEIMAYPTILINDREYDGARNLASISLAAGCDLY